MCYLNRTSSEAINSVEPQTRPRYTLDELLAQCDASAAAAPEVRKWLDAPPVGDELL